MKNNIRISILLALSLLLFSSVTFAKTYLGQVFGMDASDERLAMMLKNARVMLLPSLKGTLTAGDGTFRVEANASDTALVVSYLGYTSDTLSLASDSFFVYLKPIQLEGVEVVGQRAAQQVTFSDGVRTETITSRGLLKAACCNLSESFATTPSVDIQYTDAVTGAKRIQLLGLQSIYTQIQQTNMPILRGLASSYGFAYIPGQWLNSISISKGASTVKNGFESIAGLINIEHLKPEDDNPTLINLYGNDMMRFEANVAHTIQFNGEDNGTILFLHANHQQKELDNNDDGFMDSPTGTQINIQNNYSNHFDFENVTWENKVGYNLMYDTRKGGQMGYTSGDTSKWGMENDNRRLYVFTQNGFILDKETGTNIGSILTFTHHKQNSLYGKRIFDAEQNSFYANIMFQVPFDVTQQLTVGVGMQLDDYTETLYRTITQNQMWDEFYKGNNAYSIIYGGFAEYSFDLWKNFKVIAGIRGDLGKYTNGLANVNGEYDSYFRKDSLVDFTEIAPRLHIKYAPIEDILVFGASVGRGYRIARPIEENQGLLVSNRDINIAPHLNPEDAWNYGANMFYNFELAGITFDLKLDYYRTDFMEQTILDLDKSPDAVYIYNLTTANGKSYSNAAQIDLTLQPITNFYITTAYRITDVKIWSDGKLQQKALQSKQKAFLNFQYNTEMNEWAFDLTLDYNGSGRMPTYRNNENEIIKGENYKPFLLVNAQITKSFKNLDIYVGGENLTNYRISNAIKNNLNPFALGYDASMIYGPVNGATIYLGVRYKFF